MSIKETIAGIKQILEHNDLTVYEKRVLNSALRILQSMVHVLLED